MAYHTVFGSPHLLLEHIGRVDRLGHLLVGPVQAPDGHVTPPADGGQVARDLVGGDVQRLQRQEASIRGGEAGLLGLPQFDTAI